MNNPLYDGPKAAANTSTMGAYDEIPALAAPDHLYDQTHTHAAFQAPSARQFDRTKLKLGRIVGRGEFGDVREGLVCSHRSILMK